MAQAMAKHGADVIVYCYTSNPHEQGVNEQAHISVKSFYLPPSLQNINFVHVPPGLKEILSSNQDDLDALILTGGFIPENYPVARLLQKSKIPYVFEPLEAFNPYSYHGFKGLRKSIYENLFEKNVVNNAAAIRIISSVQERHFQARGYRLRSDKFFAMKDGVDFEDIPTAAEIQELPAREPAQENSNVFGFLGRLVIYKKGLDILLQAWSIYMRRGGAGVLKIVGPDPSGGSIAKLRSMSAGLDLKNVEILPPLHGAGKFTYLRSISILVHPSRHETIPRVLRESLAVGCPVVVTEQTNLQDLVAEKGAGYVADLDADDLAEKMYMFSQTNELQRQRMRAAALEAAGELDYNVISNRYLREIAARLAKMTAER
jgi:glycosyltransferase involved in cell wall biosynthesis